MKKILMAAVLACGVTGFSTAADLPSGNQADGESRIESYFEGAYAGVGLGMEFEDEENYWNAGAFAGYNMVIDKVLLGIEGSATAWAEVQDSDPAVMLEATGRVGMVFDNIAPYLLASIGYDTGAEEGIYGFGAGVEVMVNDHVGVRAEGRYLDYMNPPSVGWTRMSMGVVWHFN